MNRTRQKLEKKKQQGLRKGVVNFVAVCGVAVLLIAIFFGLKSKPAAPTPPPHVAKVEGVKTEPAIGGELGKAMDSLEATLVAGDKALTTPVDEKPVGIIVHDSGAKISMAPVSSKPPVFLSEAQVRQMQEDAKARQRQQKPISSPGN